MQLDVRGIIREARKVVAAHEGANPGEYHRILIATADKTIPTGINAYGCADAANILYTLDEMPRDSAERDSWVAAMQQFQNAETGLFEDGSHSQLHTTAYVLASLDFFEARAKHPLKALHPLLKKEEMAAFLDKLRWHDEPWLDSQEGAGIYTALLLNRDISREWEDWYFEWLWNEEDPATGFWRKDKPLPLNDRDAATPIFHYLGGSFHYLFNVVYAKRPQRYPERAIDTCLTIFNDNHQPLYGESFLAGISYAEIDWVYYVNRSVRQCGYRFEECQIAMQKAAEKYITYLNQLDYSNHEAFNDLHKLFGMICALSEFQQALPGQIISERPLRQVMDRRPYI
jgi:hypothetical protein